MSTNPQSTGFYIPDQQATQNKHAIPNPTLIVDLREFRKHIEVDARQRRNKFFKFISCMKVHVFDGNIHSALIAGVTKVYTYHADPSM